MKAKVITIIRVTLGLALVYGVYTETGIFTAILSILILVGSEMMTLTLSKLAKYLKESEKPNK